MSPAEPGPEVAALWPAYLDFYRESVAEAVLALPDAERRASRLPSGWTPIELLSHVLHMEQRWFVWGFLGEDVADPWGDWTTAEPWTGADETAPDARWQVPDDVTAEALVDRLRAVGRRTTEALAAHALDEPAPAGPRFDEEPPPSLEWICFHVLQEYARHAGHLDIVVELAGSEAPGLRSR